METAAPAPSITRYAALRRIQTTLAILRWPTLATAGIFAPLLVRQDLLVPFLVLLALTSVYNGALVVALRRVSGENVRWVAYLGVLLDTMALSVAIWATGGFYSPFHVAFFAIAINVSIFFGRAEATVASFLYSAFYAIAITFSNGFDIWPNIYAEFGLRVTFLLLASLFVGQLAEERISLSNLNEQLQSQIAQRERIEGTLRGLNAAALAVQRSLEREGIFNSISSELRGLGFQIAVMDYERESGNLRLAYTSVDPTVISLMERLTGNDAYAFPLVPRPEGQLREAVQSHEAVFFGSVGELVEEVTTGSIMQIVSRGMAMVPVGHVIIAPMVIRDQVTGFLCVGGNHLTRADIPAVNAFANQTAIALETAALVAELRSSLDELRETQAQLIQSAKMASVGTLAAGVAHEINNPLLAISGRAEQLLARADRYLADERAVHYVTVIRDMAERLTTIVRALLSFSRAGTGDFDPVDANAALEETLQLIEHQFQASKVEIQRHFTDGKPMVVGNKNQLQQVFMNLAINARDAMPEGGTLTISTAVRNGAANLVEISFSDTGHGMAPEIAQRIFEPFYTTKEVGKGTGLGLFVSRGIIDRHRGELEVDSALGVGTTFRLALPAWRPTVLPDSYEEEAEGAG